MTATLPIKPTTMEAAAEAYRKKAGFRWAVQRIVAEEIDLASRALDECIRDPYGIRETVYYLATSVAARVLATVYDNDGEIGQLKAEVEQLSRTIQAAANLSPTSPFRHPEHGETGGLTHGST